MSAEFDAWLKTVAPPPSPAEKPAAAEAAQPAGPQQSRIQQAAGWVGDKLGGVAHSVGNAASSVAHDVGNVTTGDVKAGVMGAQQVGTADGADEIAGAAKALGVHPAEFALAAAGGAASLGSYLGQRLGIALGGKGPGGIVQDYRQGRNDYQAEQDQALAEHPKSFRVGQGVSMVAQGAVMPAVKTVEGATALGGAVAGAGGAMGSRSDLTKGEVGGFATDTLGSAAGGALTAGVLSSAFALPGAIQARLGESKMVGALTDYLRKVTEHGGSPEAIKSVASKLFNEVEQAAGDAVLPLKNFMGLADKLEKTAQSPTTGGMAPEVEQLVKDAKALAAREGGPNVTIADIKNDLHTWSKRVKAWANDPGKQHVAESALGALKADLAEGTGNPAVADAAQKLIEARAGWAKASGAEKLQQVIVDSTKATSGKSAMLDAHIDPQKFVTLNSGKNAEKIDRLLANNPEQKAAWEMGVNAARVMARKGKSWVKLPVESPKVEEAVHKLMTFGNVTKVFTDPKMAKEFIQLANPRTAAGLTERTALAAISQLAARLAEPATDTNSPPPTAMPRELNAGIRQ